jgi:hypothetical protein
MGTSNAYCFLRSRGIANVLRSQIAELVNLNVRIQSRVIGSMPETVNDFYVYE